MIISSCPKRNGGVWGFLERGCCGLLFYCPELFSFPLDYTELQITINTKRKIVNDIEAPYTIKHIIQARKNLHGTSKCSPLIIWWSELVDLRLHHISTMVLIRNHRAFPCLKILLAQGISMFWRSILVSLYQNSLHNNRSERT